jgi:hypothetical protein
LVIATNQCEFGAALPNFSHQREDSSLSIYSPFNGFEEFDILNFQLLSFLTLLEVNGKEPTT